MFFIDINAYRPSLQRTAVGSLLLVFAWCITALPTLGQQLPPCHGASAKAMFAGFADDDEFVDKHPYPKKYTHTSKAGGEMIDFACPDGQQAKGYLIRSAEPTSKWIFVFQEWWGLNDNIKGWSEELYKALNNVNVLALDMYDGKVAADRETARRYMRAFRRQRGDMIVKGALAYAGKDAKVGTIGWCFGGGESLQAALTAGSQAVACVMYYGMPESDVARLKTLNTDVLNIWGTRDKWINKEVMDAFDKNMRQAKKTLTVWEYDADHAFANPSNPHFDQKAASDAKTKVFAYLKARMR